MLSNNTKMIIVKIIWFSESVNFRDILGLCLDPLSILPYKLSSCLAGPTAHQLPPTKAAKRPCPAYTRWSIFEILVRKTISQFQARGCRQAISTMYSLEVDVARIFTTQNETCIQGYQATCTKPKQSNLIICGQSRLHSLLYSLVSSIWN